MKLFAAGWEVPSAWRSNELERIVGRGLEARVGFEPTGPLQTRKLLISSLAVIARIARIA